MIIESLHKAHKNQINVRCHKSRLKKELNNLNGNKSASKKNEDETVVVY